MIYGDLELHKSRYPTTISMLAIMHKYQYSTRISMPAIRTQVIMYLHNRHHCTTILFRPHALSAPSPNLCCAMISKHDDCMINGAFTELFRTIASICHHSWINDSVINIFAGVCVCCVCRSLPMATTVGVTIRSPNCLHVCAKCVCVCVCVLRLCVSAFVWGVCVIH